MTVRIVYGVQGTGNGHVSRARALAPALAARGIEVHYVFSGRPAAAYFDMAPFGAWTSHPGLTFVVANGRIDPWQTWRQLRLRACWHDICALPVTGYDLVLTDFEPVTAWAARRAGVPCVHLSHQAAFLNPVPQQGPAWLRRPFLRYFAPADRHVGLHWHAFGQSLLPPLIETFPAPAATPAAEDETDDPRPAVLVYLPFESLVDIRAALQPLTGVRWLVYHPSVPLDVESGHWHWRRLSRAGFQRDLRRVAGVICNAGFELPSEALSLGVKLLVKPLRGQFEQQANALALVQLNLAQRLDTLDTAAVAAWLRQPPADATHYPDVAGALADWILAGAPDTVAAMSATLWQQVRFPACARLPEV